jgi:hypothetical protein
MIQMPQLHSGRHVGLDPKKLFDLFKQAEQGVFVHRLMAIEDGNLILRFLEIIELIPDDKSAGVLLNPFSVQTKLVFKPKSTGVFANDLTGLSLAWSQADINGIQDFLSQPRAIELREQLLTKVKKCQKLLLSGNNAIASQQALWWSTNCHPAQEEQWDEFDFWEA